MRALFKCLLPKTWRSPFCHRRTWNVDFLSDRIVSYPLINGVVASHEEEGDLKGPRKLIMFIT